MGLMGALCISEQHLGLGLTLGIAGLRNGPIVVRGRRWGWCATPATSAMCIAGLRAAKFDTTTASTTQISTQGTTTILKIVEKVTTFYRWPHDNGQQPNAIRTIEVLSPCKLWDPLCGTPLGMVMGNLTARMWKKRMQSPFKTGGDWILRYSNSGATRPIRLA